MLSFELDGYIFPSLVMKSSSGSPLILPRRPRGLTRGVFITTEKVKTVELYLTFTVTPEIKT